MVLEIAGIETQAFQGRTMSAFYEALDFRKCTDSRSGSNKERFDVKISNKYKTVGFFSLIT